MPSFEPAPVASHDCTVAVHDLVEEEYAALHALATTWFRREPQHQTLQATALIHEAFIQVVLAHGDRPRARLYYLAAMSRAMRQILVRKARRRNAIKRGAGRACVSLSSDIEGPEDLDLLALDDAISRLEADHKRSASVAVLRIFGDMSSSQIATLLSVSTRTVHLDWRYARAWLATELADT